MKRRLSQAINGANIFASVGALWAMYGAYAFKGKDAVWWMAGAFAVTAAQVVIITKLNKRVLGLPDETVTPEMKTREEQSTKAFRLVNIVQVIAIFLAVQVFYNLHTPEYLAPAIGVIVGIHFMALAGPMEMPSHWTVGGLMCVLALGTLLAVGDHARWGVVVGFGNAAILWASSLQRIQRVMSET